MPCHSSGAFNLCHVSTCPRLHLCLLSAPAPPQEVYALAKQADPELKRTLGVLTKVDLVEPACHKNCTEVLRGRHYTLDLGWHAVKNPTKVDLDARMTYQVCSSSLVLAAWACMAAEGIARCLVHGGPMVK